MTGGFGDNFKAGKKEGEIRGVSRFRAFCFLKVNRYFCRKFETKTRGIDTKSKLPAERQKNDSI